jgi:hypothetical protein
MEQQKYLIPGLRQEKQKLEKALEESKTSTLAFEIVKAKQLELNEKLKSEQKEFLFLLNDMQTKQNDQRRLQDRMTEIKEQYQKANDAFDKIVDWQKLYRDPSTILPLYTGKEKLRYHVFFDTWKPLLKDIHSIQETTTDACKKLWNSSDGPMEEFRMQLMPPIDEATPATIILVEVEKCREDNIVNIENPTQVKKDSLEEHPLKPDTLINMTEDFVQCTTRELKQEVSTKVCNGELDMENMQSGKLESIMKDYSLWKGYQD